MLLDVPEIHGFSFSSVVHSLGTNALPISTADTNTSISICRNVENLRSYFHEFSFNLVSAVFVEGLFMYAINTLLSDQHHLFYSLHSS